MNKYKSIYTSKSAIESDIYLSIEAETFEEGYKIMEETFQKLVNNYKDFEMLSMQKSG
jgi:hypothetical protein